MQDKKKIIVAPLNWGLGHASRCIPIIKILLEKNYEVIIASDGGALMLLQKEFPELESIELPGYNVHYKGGSFVWGLFLQSFKIFFAVMRENFFLKKFLKKKFEKKISKNIFRKVFEKYFQKKISEKNTLEKEFKNNFEENDKENSSPVECTPLFKIFAIISDNRYGFYNRSIEKNIFITHQYNVITPYRFVDFIANSINHFYINKFDLCLIPDVQGTPNLSGRLSHNKSVNKNKTRYIGALTRMKKFDATKVYDIIAVLSGPEPQRTYLEKIMRDEFQKYLEQHPQKKLCLVRGVSSHQSTVSYQLENKSKAIQNTRATSTENFKSKSEAIQNSRKDLDNKSDLNKSETIQNIRKNLNHPSPITHHTSAIDIFDFLTTDILNEKLMQSEVLIARSGYSTVMDLAALQMPAILIPTPGQTEQEYLAQQLMSENIFYTMSQTDFDLEKSLLASKNYTGFKENKFIYPDFFEAMGL